VPPDLIRQALQAFAAGDVPRATRLWLEAHADDPDNEQVTAALEHVRALLPDLVADVERQMAGALPAKPPVLEVAKTIAASPTQRPPSPGTPPGLRVVPSPAKGKGDPWEDGGTLTVALTVASTAPGFALVEKARPPETGVATVPTPGVSLGALETRLHELLELDNFSGALEAAEQILREKPAHPEASRARAHCQERLARLYASKLGRLEAVPRVSVALDQMIWLNLDHRAGFVLAQVDGASSFADIIEVTGMDRLEALHILAELVANKVIAAS
jgi:hypothetical protein